MGFRKNCASFDFWTWVNTDLNFPIPKLTLHVLLLRVRSCAYVASTKFNLIFFFKHLSVKNKIIIIIKTVNLTDELSFTVKLGQRRSGELRGFSKTRQNPRELGVFSDLRTTKSRINTGGHRICVCIRLLYYGKCTGFYCLFLIGRH